jgi:hypothetical protein
VTGIVGILRASWIKWIVEIGIVGNKVTGNWLPIQYDARWTEENGMPTGSIRYGRATAYPHGP